jgi:hypothetical protein
MEENPFEHMDAMHIEQVWAELTTRFGFPEKKWKAKFKKYLSNERLQNRDETVGPFLRFGNAHINPILNSLLLRNPGNTTFNSLCEYVISNSVSYRTRLARRQRMYDR